MDTGFFNWITLKYHMSQQRHRRFPPLTLLILKRPPILQSLPWKKITVHHSHAHYYLNHNLFFNLDLFTQNAGKSQVIIKDPLKTVSIKPGLPVQITHQTLRHGEPVKIKKGLQLLVNHLETLLVHQAYPEFSNNLTVSFIETLQKQLQASPLMDRTTFKEERVVVYEGPGPAAGKSSIPEILFHGEPLRAMEILKESVKILNSTAVSKTVSFIERLQEQLQTSPFMVTTTAREDGEVSYAGLVPVTGKSSTIETLLHKEPLRSLEKLKETEFKETKSKESVKILNTTAVFKPLLTGAKLQSISTGFKGLIYVERPGQFTPEQEEKQGLVGRKQSSPGIPYPDAKKSSPTLNYTNSIQNTLENIKQTVTGVEKKVEEEITLIKESYSDGSGISDSSRGIPPGMTTNISQLSDQVYRKLEKRIKFERQRRGW